MDEVKSSHTPDPHVLALLGSILDVVRSTVSRDAPSGLRPSHFRLLSALPDDGLSTTELAGRLGMTKQGCGQFVTTLDSAGFVTVAAPPSDRRVRMVRRTEAGHQVVRVFEDRVQRLEEDWADRVGAHRYATFRRVMAELAGRDAEGSAEPGA